MCRNIKPLFNFEPPATDNEIRDAALQFVRKISGFTKPSKVNEEAFFAAVDRIGADATTLLNALKTNALPRSRDTEAVRRRERAVRRSPGNSRQD
jgi:hypothetical protein